mmetsp:Transcript_37000/g.95935  ORF Transcript_37000/g.95935 Transcript_37000/m.95935 type:complete len:233 (-) Transcript_37000:1023-1721(-)
MRVRTRTQQQQRLAAAYPFRSLALPLLTAPLSLLSPPLPLSLCYSSMLCTARERIEKKKKRWRLYKKKEGEGRGAGQIYSMGASMETSTPISRAMLMIFAILTALLAASSRSGTARMRSSLCSISFLASSTLVPCSLTTRGTLRTTSEAARMIPWAITSQRMIPPKMLTRIHSTRGSLLRILKASTTWFSSAPPPTSRKLAGLPPYSLMMSMVAMASPAPFTMHPMLPSRPM